ncbi:MAG: ComEA family DNA-binding protein [Porticoccaceae bacterium]
MNVTASQRCILLVILAIIFILALLKGVMQTAEIDELTSTKIQPFSDQVTKAKPKLNPNKSATDEDVNKVVLINSASAEEIAKNLKGIGVAIAQRIVLRRQQQGPYQNFDQLKAVSGVGVAKIEANRDRISFD